MKRALQWTIGVSLVVAAWGVSALTPPEDAREAPFPVRASIGEPAVGRNLHATISSVRHADTVTSGDWSADGNWIVVELSAGAILEPGGLFLTTLETDGRTYSASERVSTMRRQSLDAGLTMAGDLAFELPPDVRTGGATIVLGMNPTPRLDSVIELSVDLAALDTVDSIELNPTESARS
ncbi:hypothetical protein GCM10009775_15720 [Microbacterium aoyamense]|uniref:DUF4352 domain-containing protein n=1 Tax=Microbacterium aoyamense TaxID=344166 RepID=A0ABN2PLB4_9MICO|nr:hypothetical protein [Microbacterium aoyamense]